MSVREIRAAGREALTLATELLQRARLADEHAGIWEAADVQWWSRKPRPSDDVEKVFWVDDQGPLAGVLVTAWTDTSWQFDPVVVPGVAGVELDAVWARTLEKGAAHGVGGFTVPIDDGDATLRKLAEGSGLVPGESDGTSWMDAADRPEVEPPAEGFVLVDRTQRRGTPHPMRHRNGDEVQERLDRCSLYDPELDLAVETADGAPAAYSLYWFDPVTKVGLVEPVRVEDEYQRRGLATAMLTAGIDRLAARGAWRIKVSHESEGAAALYRSVGFQPTSTATWYEARP